jgi:hypothetical protein
VEKYSLILVSKHCIGDGISLHYILQEFFVLIGGPDPATGVPRTDVELAKLLDNEWSRRTMSHSLEGYESIPLPTEARFLPPKSRLQAAAMKVDYLKNQESFIVRVHS